MPWLFYYNVDVESELSRETAIDQVYKFVEGDVGVLDIVAARQGEFDGH